MIYGTEQNIAKVFEKIKGWVSDLYEKLALAREVSQNFRNEIKAYGQTKGVQVEHKNKCFTFKGKNAS